MNIFDDKILTEPKVVKAMIARTRNEIIRLHVNNVYLETLKKTDKGERNGYELKMQLDQNRKDIEGDEQFLLFLERFAKTVKKGCFKRSTVVVKDTAT